VTAARPCSKTSPSSPVAVSSAKTSASSSRTSPSKTSAAPSASPSTRKTPRSSKAKARTPTSRAAWPDPPSDRGNHLRLRQGKAPGTPGQAGRRRCRHQCRRRDRDRAQGKESPRRRRPARDPRGRGRRHRPRRRCGPHPRPEGPRQARVTGDEKIGVQIIRRAIEQPLRTLAENAGGKAPSSSTKSRSRKGNEGYNVATGEYVDLVKAGVVDPTKVTRSARCRTRPPSAACSSRPKRS
jgi:hypothetical protein